MFKPLLLAAALAALAEPTLAAQCRHYETGVGPALDVDDDATIVTVDFGDWTEKCPIHRNTHPKMVGPGLGFGSGWLEPMVAKCKNFTSQISFAPSREGGEDYDLAVFYGQVFYRACK